MAHSLVASPEKILTLGKKTLTVTHKGWYLSLPSSVFGGRSFNYGLKNESPAILLLFAVCSESPRSLHPGTSFHEKHQHVARSSCRWMDSPEVNWKTGPQVSVGSSLLCSFGPFVPLPLHSSSISFILPSRFSQ